MNTNHEDLAVEVLVEVAKDQAAEVYRDVLKDAAQETGGALSAIVGLFNHVVLFPVKKANLGFRYKLECFENDLRERMKNTPADKIVEPPLMIAGPTLEALKYTFDVEELRGMFLNLLAASMRKDDQHKAHPSFVDIIKSMSSLDAQIFGEIVSLIQIPSATITLGFDDKIFPDVLPKNYIPGLLGGQRDPFLVSASIDHLKRLGIVLHLEESIVNFDYDRWKSDSRITEAHSRLSGRHPDKVIEIELKKSVVLVTDFGKIFSKMCLPKGK